MPIDDSARRLREARERAGLSQREAAVRLGIHYGSLNRYEQGRMRVPADVLTRAEALVADPPMPGGRPPPDAGVLLSERQYGRIIGTLETMERWTGSVVDQMSAAVATARAFSESMHALRAQVDALGQATSGAVGMMRGAAGETPPPPPPPTTERPVISSELFRTRDEALGGDTRQAGGAG